MRPAPDRASRIKGIAIPVLAALLAVPGCGGAAGQNGEHLSVAAASSLKAPLQRFTGGLPSGLVKYEFAGSDRLATAIRAGRRPDIFISASPKISNAVASAGLSGKPVAIARNTLVIAIPATGGSVRSIADLAHPGTTIAMGSATVPVGTTADRVLAGLPEARRKAILANVRTREPDAAGVIGKLHAGAVMAAFAWRTDVITSGGRLRAIPIDPALDPTVTYEAAVINGTRYPKGAAAFIQSLRSGAGQRHLRAAGFLPPDR